MSSDSSKNNQISPLGEVELEACRLHFEGYSSNEIEKIFLKMFPDYNPKASTIRGWFSPKGKLAEFYKEYAKTEGDVRRSEARDAFRAHLKSAVRVLLAIMNDPTEQAPSRVAAARMIIDRELGEPIKPLLPLAKDPAERILEEMGIIAKKNDTTDSENS